MTASVGTSAVRRRLLVGGEWVATRERREIRSPYSGDVVGEVAWGTADDAARALDAAAAAMEAPLPLHERVAILERTAAGLDDAAEAAAATICAEAGKPLKAARTEVARAVATLRAAAVEAHHAAGETIPIDAVAAGAGKTALTLRIPAGVVAAITPFNFPLNLVAHKVAPALAAGCAVVLKPAEKTPLSALILAEQFVAAGLPAGWLNVVVGPPSELTDVWLRDDRVAVVTFTGSASVGWSLTERARRKKVLLELGNATPAIVDDSADVETAARKLAPSAFGFAGQTCISVQRIYVLRGVFDAFLDAFLREVAQLRVGDPADERTDVGPLIDDAARARVAAAIDDACALGATVLAGGSDGRIIRPTVLTGTPATAAVSRREIFGPVVLVDPVDGLDEALARANATEYGLHAGIFTKDLVHALRAARELRFAGVLVNETPTFRVEHMPYGGDRASGNTREGPRYAIREYTTERLVIIDGGS